MAASGTALPAEASALFTETIMQNHQLPVTPSKAQFYFLRDARENTRNCASTRETEQLKDLLPRR